MSALALSACSDDQVPDSDGPIGTETDTQPPATPVRLELSLGAQSSVAGEAVDYTVALIWSDDSTTTPAELVTSDAQPDLSVDASTLTPTLAGEHTIEVSTEGLDASATLSVTAAAPHRVDFTLDPIDGLDPTDESVATVSLWDTYDNVVNSGAALSVEPSGATVDELVVTFDQDGSYTVTATANNSDVTAQIGPIIVDSAGPMISIDPPERGAWLTPSDTTVSGRITDALSDVTTVTLAGEAQTLDSEGRFEAEVTWEFGMNPLTCTAADSDGNNSEDLRAVLVGDTLAYGSADDDGLIVRLHDGDDGLNAIAALLTDSVDAKTVEAELPDPLYSGTKEECTVFFGRKICVTFKLDLVATGLRFKTVTASLDAKKGELLATLVIDDPELDWRGTGEASSVKYSDTGTATADKVTVTATLRPRVVGSAIEVDISKVEATVKDLDLGLSGSIKTVTSRLGVSLDSTVKALLEDAVIDAVEADLPSAMEDALNTLTWTQELALGDSTATLAGELNSLDIDDLGMTVRLATTVTLDRWSLPRKGPGSLAADYGPPKFTGKPGAVVALDQDFVNQVLYASWGSGMMSESERGVDLGLDASLVKILLPDIKDLHVVVDPLYAPVAVPGEGADLLDLQIADTMVSLYDGAPSGEPPYRFYVHGVAGLDITVKDGLLVASAGTPELFVHVDRAPNGVDRDGLRKVIESLLPKALDEIAGTLSDIELPEPGGLTISSPTVSLEGPEDGFVTVGGGLK